MKSYIDSSSLAKRYIDESGSEKLQEFLEQSDEMGLSIVAVPEVLSALNRRRRENSISNSDYETAKSQLLTDLPDVEIIDVSADVISTTIGILEKSAVRTLDAIHIASAVRWKADIFISSDIRQLQAAETAGIKTLVI